LPDYHALEWADCTVGGNAKNELRPGKSFAQPSPVAGFEAPAKGRVGESIRFANASHSPKGRIAAVQWDFNDGAPVSEMNPTHVYHQASTYRVMLLVWDESGRAARAEQRLEVVAVKR
jgi:PKD repeat protein